MPRYYFDLHDNGVVTADEEGEELPDIAAVEREAAGLAADLTGDLLKNGSLRFSIEVRDGAGRIVVRSVVSLDVERVPTSPS
jgi:hypothetical protein